MISYQVTLSEATSILFEVRLISGEIGPLFHRIVIAQARKPRRLSRQITQNTFIEMGDVPHEHPSMATFVQAPPNANHEKEKQWSLRPTAGGCGTSHVNAFKTLTRLGVKTV